MRSRIFFLVMILAAAAIYAVARQANHEYYFFAIYTVLQYVVLATAWNILGGYTGYVNFGSAAFFAVGAYSTVVLHKLYPLLPDTLQPLLSVPLMIIVGGVVCGLI